MEPTTLPVMWWPLMQAPSIKTRRCAICGNTYPLNQHHMVPRSAGQLVLTDGTIAKKPTITLCGSGNTSGCHGKAHSHTLHFRYRDNALEYLFTDEPTKYQTALKLDGWKPVNQPRYCIL